MALIDMLMQGGNGQAMAVLARQFGMSTAQAEQAVEALMPAFSKGLKQNAADPAGFAKFMNALASGKHGNYFDAPEDAVSAGGMAEGNAILGHLFGSKEVSRAVAAQAAQASGFSQAILKQMLPALAPMILGGIFKQMTGQVSGGTRSAQAGNNPFGQILEQMMGGAMANRQGGAANPWGQILEQMMGGARGGQPGGGTPGMPGTGGDNPLGRIFEEMMRGGQAGQPRQQSPQAPSGTGNPWGDILEQMTGGSRTGGRSGPSGMPAPGSDNPLGRIFEEMMRGGQGAPAPETRSREQETPEETGRSRGNGGLGDLFGEMFDTGRTVQKDYQRNVDNIFDEFLKGMNNR